MIPPRSFFFSALALLASTALHIRNVAAQVHTDCQPLDRDDCPANKAFSMAHTFNFNSTPTAWDTTAGKVDYSPDKGATFTIQAQGDSPTVRTQYYIFFGRVEILLKAASGRGIISSVMLLSDDLDEIDWEFLGSNNTHASTNFFGKGRLDYSQGRYHAVAGGVQDAYRNYTLIWTKDRMDFFIDNGLVRTLLPKDANNTQNYPQTPMRVSIGIWAGGDPRLPEDTRAWAGGDTDYSKGPYSMFVKSARIEDFSSGKEYVYGDRSGSWQSIKVVAGQSTANETVNAVPQPSLSVADRWNALSPAAKTGIYAGAGGFVALLAGALLLYFIKQRRRGAQEAKLAEQRMNQEHHELEQYRKAGINPDALTIEQTEYHAADLKRDITSDGLGYSIPSTPVDTAGPLDEKSSTAPQTAWGAGHNPAIGAAAIATNGGMRSPMPLLHEGAQSPRAGSPGPQSAGFPTSPGGPVGYDPRDNGSLRSPSAPPMHSLSPIRNPSPGMPPPFPMQSQRSFTTPNPRNPAGSPGPPQMMGRYGDGDRTNSPGPMGPQRSFTNDPYRGPSGQQQGGGDGYWR